MPRRAASSEPASVLAERYNLSLCTVYKWKRREVFTDKSHTAHRLQTTLTPAQEAIVVQLRKTLLLPLDDLLSVTREFLCKGASRSGLDRCLRRHGVGNLNALKPATAPAPHKAFKAYEPELPAHGPQVPAPDGGSDPAQLPVCGH